MYEQLKILDKIPINFSAGNMHIINIVLAFVMFGVALGIRPQMFKDVLMHPKSAVLGLSLHIIGLPLMTFLLVILLNSFHLITPMVAMGMILVASCPGGNMSNFMSHFSKANTELAVSLTAINTALATFITPFNFWFWGSMYVNFINKRAAYALQDLHIDNFQMFETVFILLGIPLVVGMLTARYLPKIAEKLKKPMQYFSFVFFIIMIILAFSNNFDIFIQYIFFIFILVLIHNGTAFAMGYGWASLWKLSERDRRTLTIETGIQNSGLGLVLLFNPKIFPHEVIIDGVKTPMLIGGMLFVTAWWGIWHIVSGLSISTYWSRKPPKEL